MPSLEKLHAEMKNDPFVVLAVALREERQTLRRFAVSNRLDFRILTDEYGSVATLFKVRGVPTAVLVDDRGYLAGMTVGARRWDANEVRTVMQRLSERPS